MLKRKILFTKKILKFKIWRQQISKNLLTKSFQTNHFIKPKERLSFFIKTEKHNFNCTYYKSQNKLHCFMTYSMRVPTSKLNLSRFYINKGFDQLYLTNYQK